MSGGQKARCSLAKLCIDRPDVLILDEPTAALNEDDSEPTDLDACRGHYDETRGYHYHVSAPGTNNFINCLQGAYVK